MRTPVSQIKDFYYCHILCRFETAQRIVCLMKYKVLFYVLVLDKKGRADIQSHMLRDYWSAKSLFEGCITVSLEQEPLGDT